jgi:hypothetical protein
MTLTQERKRQLLEDIAQRNGGVLRPEDIVREAASSAHELHDVFEWDDLKAAHEHRVEQARTLVRSVRVVVTTEKKQVEVVYYVRDPRLPTEQAGYIALPKLQMDAEIARQAIAAEFNRSLAALRRARDLAIALGADAKVDSIIESIEKLAGELPQLRAVG